MVRIVRYISAAALVSVVSAVPMYRRDDGSAIGSEIPVSAPFGIPMSDVPSSTDSSTDTSIAAATDAAPPPPPPPMASSMDMASMPPPMASSTDMASMPPPMATDMASIPLPMATDMASMPPPMASSTDMASMPPPMANSTDLASMPPPPMASSMVASDTLSAVMPQMTYGSGSSSSGNGYNSCVQQCAASFGMPSTPSGTQASVGGGVTHTVIVAPTQGVLRYIPFSTNASVGDTVSFIWGAGPHTVTQSSALEVCNKTSAPGAFASGSQNKTFVFNQVINNTNPVWFYCGIPNHCQKGMFGGVNIGQPDPTGSSTSFTPLSSVMANLTAMDPTMGAMLAVTKTKTAGNLYASNWGMNTNTAGMTAEAMMQTAQNVMYMQTLIAANPQAMKGGQFTVTTTNLTIPADFIASGNSSMPMPMASSASAAASGAAAAASSAMPAAATAAKANSAGSITSSSVIVGLVAIVATFFAL